MNFRGKYRFLSNFYPCKIIAWGIEFPTSEHVYVAAKTFDMDIRKKIAEISTPGKAKRFGRTIELRRDWEEAKVPLMRNILHRKFVTQHPDLGVRLSAIPEDIIEHNRWHDNFWGVCSCNRCPEGENVLGSLLMDLRDDLRTQHGKGGKMTEVCPDCGGDDGEHKDGCMTGEAEKI